MLRNAGHRLARQLLNRTINPSVVLTADHYLTLDICHLGVLSDGFTSICVPGVGRSTEHCFRVYSTTCREFRSSSALQQGRAEPVAAVHHPNDIVPEDLVINRAEHLKVRPLLDAASLKFGSECTDHMLNITWKEGVGWGTPSIDPLGPISIHPCAQVLHYGMECFEGMKAFKASDGGIRLFRPDLNMNRLSRSAARLALPTFDKEVDVPIELFVAADIKPGTIPVLWNGADYVGDNCRERHPIHYPNGGPSVINRQHCSAVLGASVVYACCYHYYTQSSSDLNRAKEALLDCIKALLRVERDWIPDEEGFSLYIRPTIISTYPHLGLGPPGSAAIFCVLSPVGPYFPEGLKPIKLFVDKKHVRAFPGGIGDAKVGGNYAPTILPQLKGAERGCSQVLYVLDDGREGGAVGESGAMNVFFLLKKDGKLELITPPLDGVILPGVTRDSVLALTRTFGNIQVSERRLPWNEIVEADKKGTIVEVFGSGTACMVQPIIGLMLEDEEIRIPFDEKAALHWAQKPAGSSLEEPKKDEPVSLSGRLTRAILDIQYGHTSNTWSVPI